ncbi:NADP-specific glutamate dehydrogenase-like isoform X2 [Salvia splendens]|uniref:NADP-specific glutamate dehydrogenase-like isoform X2 n=1 Tax=Salvia splendens TaxID=180675 RepID=UPI001C254232|nr:NADP-specific glutamate dehydrogenase-like isoform X2 [Salvia splendens]
MEEPNNQPIPPVPPPGFSPSALSLLKDHKMARVFFNTKGEERVQCSTCVNFGKGSNKSPYVSAEGSGTIRSKAFKEHCYSAFHINAVNDKENAHREQEKVLLEIEESLQRGVTEESMGCDIPQQIENYTQGGKGKNVVTEGDNADSKSDFGYFTAEEIKSLTTAATMQDNMLVISIDAAAGGTQEGVQQNQPIINFDAAAERVQETQSLPNFDTQYPRRKEASGVDYDMHTSFHNTDLEYGVAHPILQNVLKNNVHDTEFIQVLKGVVRSLEKMASSCLNFADVMKSLLEPECALTFRVSWIDGEGIRNVNRGYWVCFNRSLGPCRGGLRFHRKMNLSVAKLLSLEQTFRNALSGLTLGGCFAGSNFDPTGKTNSEVKSFCESFMNSIHFYLGVDKDLLSEDMGVGIREMGFLYGQYRRIKDGVGPTIHWFGSAFRIEAMAYGLVFFAHLILTKMEKDLKGLRCAISGFGKLSLQLLEKLIDIGAVPVTISDSKGYLLDEDGFDLNKIALLKELKAGKLSLREYIKTYKDAFYVTDSKPWNAECDVAFPCALHSEICPADALALGRAGCTLLVEGSCMSCTPEAIEVLKKQHVLVAPSVAAGVGGIVMGQILLRKQVLKSTFKDYESKVQEALKVVYEGAERSATLYGYKKGVNSELQIRCWKGCPRFGWLSLCKIFCCNHLCCLSDESSIWT